MTTLPPEGADTTRPSPARLYDYYLGGKDNYPADRHVGDSLLEQIPELRSMARANRAWLLRVVGFMARQGVDQFLDLGAWLRAQVPTHQVAQSVHAAARVVYVDHDPVAGAHANAMLANFPERTTVVGVDMRDPHAVLDHPYTRRLIDFDRPVGLLFVAVLHFLPDSVHPHQIVRTYRDPLEPGSCMAISHLHT